MPSTMYAHWPLPAYGHLNVRRQLAEIERVESLKLAAAVKRPLRRRFSRADEPCGLSPLFQVHRNLSWRGINLNLSFVFRVHFGMA